MSKLNVSIATALTAATVASVSAAQVPSVRTGSEKNVAVQPGDAAATPSAGANQTPSGSPVHTGAESPPVQAGSDAPTATAPVVSASASQPGWVTSPPVVATSAPEVRGEVSTGGEVRIQREPASPGKNYSYRFTATVDVANVLWRGGRGYDLFSERDASWRFGVGFGYDVLRLPQNLVLAVEAGFLHEPAHGDNLDPLFGGLSGSLSATTILLGPSLRWSLTPWLAPYGRVGVLATSFNMDLDAGNATSWSYHEWAGGALLGAGVLLSLPPSNPVNFGVLVEGGYWLQRDVPIQLERDLPRDAIATSSARVGTLENTGPYLRAAGVLRF